MEIFHMKVKLKLFKKPIPTFRHLSTEISYYVLGIEADDFRIVDIMGEPLLFPHKAFDIVDSKEPSDWITEYGEDGERYSYPKEFGAPGFFENYFDRDHKTIEIFNNYIKKIGLKYSDKDQKKD
jgi:hypothetical protein